MGHGINSYAHKKGIYVRNVHEKLVWMLKTLTLRVTNLSGPRKIWVTLQRSNFLLIGVWKTKE